MLTLDQVKLKSMPRMSGLHPVLMAATMALIERCYARGVPIIITQGLRTIADQNGLYAKGRTQEQLNAVGLSHVKAQPKETKVTNAIGGTSNHNYGLAIDFALLLPDGRTVSWDTLRDGDKDSLPDWSEVVEEAKRLGFEWGGEWRTFKDLPHLQMVFGLKIADLQAGRKPTGVQMDAAYARIDKLKGEGKVVKKDVKVTVKVNGKKIEDGVLDDGVTYLPVRAVAEALGLTVGWDQPSKTVTLTKGAK